MKNKRGQMAEGINMMYRLFMVTVVAFVVFGAGSFVYSYYIDVRDVEARILIRSVVDCLIEDGILDLNGELLEGCEVAKSERVYVGIEVVDEGGQEIADFDIGDSGALWIKDLFGEVVDGGKAVLGHETNGVAKYRPGYYESNYSVFVVDGENRQRGKMFMEVLVNYADE